MHEEVKKEYGTLIAKKSERLVTALYLVTDLMSDSEPIKHGMRKNAVALLSSMNAIAQFDVKDRVIEFKMSLRSVMEITSLLHVSVTAGIVSDMNGEILMDGFRSLQLVLEKRQPMLTKEMLTIDNEQSLSEGLGFSSAITSTSYDVLTPLNLARFSGSNEASKHVQTSPKNEHRENKGQNYSDKMSDRTAPKINAISKDTSLEPNVLNVDQSKTFSTIATSFQMRKNGRREQILNLFIKGVDVSIKDIASRIRGCSEKTIQRELNSLLYDNVIKRIGEKRWSRYVLK